MPLSLLLPRVQDVRPGVLLFVAYLLAAKVGLQLAFVHASATAVWPPTGLALGALLVFGWRLWPAILLGAFVANVTTAGSPLSSLAIAIGNTLEALLGAALVTRFADGASAFQRPQTILRFVLLGALLSPVVSATWGVTSLVAFGHADWSAYPSIWLTWWLGDASGAIVVAPLVVLWAREPRPAWTAEQWVEVALLLAGFLIASEIVFGGVLPIAQKKYPIPFLMIPILIWTAFRFSPRETATMIGLTSAVAIWGTLEQLGPFAREPQHEALLLLQGFNGVVAVMSMMLAAGMAEQKRAEQEVREAHAELEGRVRDRTAKLAETNAALRREIEERQATEAALRAMHDELEQRVKDRTAALAAANAELQDKIAELEKFQDAVVGRELRMIELEREMESLRRKLHERR